MAAEKGFDAIPPTLKIVKEVHRGSFGVVYLATQARQEVCSCEAVSLSFNGQCRS